MSYQVITLEKKDQIYFLGLGKFEEKTLSVITEAMLLEMDKALDDIAKDKDAEGLILFSHKKDCFLAGMDISVIEAISSEADAIMGCERGQSVFNKLEDLKCETMALVDGVCLGGGLEMVLACDKIVCSDSKKTMFALPEVKLGVLPGFGGTYRLVKKIGLTNALGHILQGSNIRPKKAKAYGMVMRIVPRERLMEKAEQFLKEKKSTDKNLNDSLMGMVSDNFLARKMIFQKAREKVLATTKGHYPAPLKIIDHLEASYGQGRSTYLAREARSFGELSQTSQSKALQHVFFLHDQSKKRFQEKKHPLIQHSAVVGAGTMGGGIAWLLADNHQAPLLKDISWESIELGLAQSSSVFRKKLSKKRMTEEEFNRKQRSITPTLDYAQFKSCELVIEAIIEKMEIKQALFKEMEDKVSSQCLLTSNTSSLSVTEMASVLKKPQRFAGLHFFNPVHKMPLVEIISHTKASEETIAKLYQWSLKVGKVPVVVKDGPGFLVNRILAPFLNEASYLLLQGVRIQELERAALNFGMPMGPCRLMDEIGLDVCSHVAHIMQEGLGERLRATDMAQKALEKNLLGKKNGKGFYLYEEGKETGENSEVLELLPSENIEMDETEIQMRLFLPMINEAAYILDEGIASDAQSVDIGVIFGLGFPPFRGGLLKYADHEGIDNIVVAIERFASSVNKDRYKVSELLLRLQKEKKGFYQL